MPEKKYLIQGKEYTYRELTFGYLKRAKVLKKTFKDFANEEFSLENIRRSFDKSKDNLLSKLSGKELREIAKLESDPEKVFNFITPENSEQVLEYMRRVSDIIMLEDEAIEEFLDDPDNVKLILTTCLDGPVESIDYDVKNEALISLRKSVKEIFQDFFLRIQNNRGKLLSGTTTSPTSSTKKKTTPRKKPSKKSTRLST